MKRIFLSLIAAAAFTACSTDDIQPSEFDENAAFNTPADLKTGTFAIYSTANSTTPIQFSAWFTDESSVGASNGGQGLELHAYNLNANTGFASTIWLSNYQTIVASNVLLEASENFDPADMEAEDLAFYNEARAEALFFRAYAHGTLLSHYATDMTDDSAPGVIAVDFVPTIDDQLPRNTVGEVFELIFNDLDEAEAGFDAAGTAVTTNFVNANTVKALRARMAIYRGNADLAESNVNDLLNSGLYSLTDGDLFNDADSDGEVDRDEYDETTNYNLLWIDEDFGNNPELIFEFVSTPNSGVSPSTIWNTNESSVAGAPIFEMNRNILNELEENFEDFGDVRRIRYVDGSSLISDDYASEADPREADQIIVDKYPGNIPLGEPRLNDNKIFRTAELYLILAEANVMQGDLDAAEDAIDEIRDSRYFNDTDVDYDSENEALADILFERKLELYGEGHRYIDVKRLGSTVNQGYDRNETDCTLLVAPVCDLPASDFRTEYLPIPFNEIRGNNAIEQNPNY